MGDLPHFRSLHEEGEPDQVLRLDKQIWEDLGQPVSITVNVEVSK